MDDLIAEQMPFDMTGKAGEIYSTAASLIVDKGFNATSMNDIASAVDLTKAGLYHYIRGKRDLLFSIMNFAMDMVDNGVLEPASAIDDPEERLRYILGRHAGMTDHVKALTILADEVGSLAEPDREVIIRRKRRYFNFVRDTLQELSEAGKLRDLDVSVATLNLFATILGLARWYSPDGPLSAREVADETAKLLLNGLLKTPLTPE
jgi:TetR/AcrR family transcriptional regulator, cholesterol catabolism regulator